MICLGLYEDEEVMSYLSGEGIEDVIRNENFLKHVDYIFNRVFGGVDEKSSVAGFVGSLDDLSRL